MHYFTRHVSCGLTSNIALRKPFVAACEDALKASETGCAAYVTGGPNPCPACLLLTAPDRLHFLCIAS